MYSGLKFKPDFSIETIFLHYYASKFKKRGYLMLLDQRAYVIFYCTIPYGHPERNRRVGC